jgi:hypothetical protein
MMRVHDCGKDEICAKGGGVGDGMEIEGCNFGGRVSGAYVLSLLVHVALCCSH